jgi:hypothetical protein
VNASNASGVFNLSTAFAFGLATLLFIPYLADAKAEPKCTVGQECLTANSAGGMKQLYLGIYQGEQYFTTPGGCTDSATPVCDGSMDTVQKAWAWGDDSPSATSAYGIRTGATNRRDGSTQSMVLARDYADTDAAKYCESMDFAGFTDWYLPSEDELAMLHRNSDSIGGFDESSNYWSSTEYNRNYAKRFSFDGGGSSYFDKTTEYHIRCIRRS